VIVPHAVDQPFWARTVHARGASPKPVKAKRLDARHLADSLREAMQDPIAARAADIGRRIRDEDGVAAAVSVIGAAVGRQQQALSLSAA
jgi:sterol 3beta-glucosyltransferase